MSRNDPRLVRIDRLVREDLVDKVIPSPHFSPGWPTSAEYSGLSVPWVVVIHYTGGPHDSAAKWFADPRAKASAHFVIQRDGIVILCVPVFDRAWHAGESTWKGHRFCNRYAFGIELENWGPIVRRGDGYFVWPPVDPKTKVQQFRRRFQGTGIHHAPFRHDFEFWETYDPRQIDSLVRLLECLALPHPDRPDEVPGILPADVVGHEVVAPGRKIDPGPAFPWKEVLNRAFEIDSYDDPGIGAETDESDEHFFQILDGVSKDRGDGVA